MHNGTTGPHDPTQNYSGHVPLRNFGTNPSPPPYQAPMGTQTTPANTNTNNFNGQTSFQNSPRSVPSAGNSSDGNQYSPPSNKGPGKKGSKKKQNHNHNHAQPSTSSTQQVQSRNLGTG